jgi:hypothetical protein
MTAKDKLKFSHKLATNFSLRNLVKIQFVFWKLRNLEGLLGPVVCADCERSAVNKTDSGELSGEGNSFISSYEKLIKIRDNNCNYIN